MYRYASFTLTMRVAGNKAVGAFEFVKKGIAHTDVRLLIPLIGFGCFNLSQWLVDDLEQHA